MDDLAERKKFEVRLEQARETGLVDLKYFFEPQAAMKPEDIYRAMNEFDEASKVGKRHSKWKGNVAAPEKEVP